jgi:hypothetical protein
MKNPQPLCGEVHAFSSLQGRLFLACRHLPASQKKPSSSVASVPRAQRAVNSPSVFIKKTSMPTGSGVRTRSLNVTIPVNAEESVSGVLAVPQGFEAGRTFAVITAHGAGNDMHSPLLVHFSEGLCRAGYLSLRFNFPYKENGRKAPDPQEKLVRAWQAAFEFVKNHSEFHPAHIVAAGKSMGGRVASQMKADGLLPARALVFLGYPLHPPGRKDQLRDAHLYRIAAPMLFFAGTRDALCDIDLLRSVLNRLKTPWELETIDGGDHSFVLPKSFKTAEGDVFDRILQRAVTWLNQVL